MLMRPGPLVSALSGSIGGVTAGNGKGGPYLALRRRPASAHSAKQQAQQALMRSIQASWITLTDDQRTAWRYYAASTPITNRLGVSRTVSGWQMFLGVNMFRMGAPGAPLSTNPGGRDPSQPPTTCSLASSSSTNLVLTVDYPQTASNTRLTVYGARTTRSTPILTPQRWTIVTGGRGDTVGTTIDIYSAFSAALGAPATLEYVFAGVRYSWREGLPTALRFASVNMG